MRSTPPPVNKVLCLLLGGTLTLGSVGIVAGQGSKKRFTRPPRREISQADAERRRQAFEEAMRKIEAAEKAREAQEKREQKVEEATKAAQADLRRSIDAEATAARERLQKTDAVRAEAQGFASDIARKVPEPLREKFEQPPPVKPKPVEIPDAPPPKAAAKTTPVAKATPETSPVAQPTPKSNPTPQPQPTAVAVEGGTPLPAAAGVDPTPAPLPETEDETVIDAAKVIFDGSGRFGEKYQVVVFEDEVEVKNPEFKMSSDKLVAFFKRGEPVTPEVGVPLEALAEEPPEEGSQLERAVATGREVVVTKVIEGGEPQIAKARKATYFADREEVMLEIWPQVQRGRNLVIAKAKETVIILKGEEMIVKGPVRTKIVGKGAVQGDTAGGDTVRNEGAEQTEHTVIDAERGAVFNRPSGRTGEKEVFFDGSVNVADPSFDMIGGDSLTAYLVRDEKAGDTVMRSAVMRGQRVEVNELTGDRRRGAASAVTFIPESGDIKLVGDPEIFDGIQHKKLDSPTAVLFLNKDTNAVKGRGGRAKMSFTPGSGTSG